MLQLISGKFYKSDELHTSNGYGILYSNYSWVAPLQTCVGIIEPCDRTGSIISYVFRYINQLERDTDTLPQLVRTGDGEIVEQFRLIASFGLNCYFNLEKDIVIAHCRATRRSYTDDFVPSKFVARTLDSRIDGVYEETQEFTALVEHLIGLSRRDYKTILAFITNYVHALEAINFNLDLAYSMLVYCLESLAKQFGREYVPAWCDYDQKSAKLVNRALKNVSEDIANQVRGAILSGAHLRLRKRYVEFCSEHVADSYFSAAPAGITGPLRRSQLEAVLSNTYHARSGYVHELRQIGQQLRTSVIAGDDVFVWDNEPHLTFRGLARLTRHIALSVIASLPKLQTEDLDWRSELPGIIQMEWAPEYWVGRTAGFVPGQARKRLSGFLQSLIGFLIEDADIIDVPDLLGVIQRTLPTSSREDARAMVALYLLFNCHVKAEYRIPGWETTISKFQSALDDCSIESMISHLLVSTDWPWDAATAEAAYREFSCRRFKATALTVPALLEAALLCRIGAAFLDAGDLQSFQSWLDAARLEVPSQPAVQQMILFHRENGTAVPVQLFWQVARVGWVVPPTGDEVSSDSERKPETGSPSELQRSNEGIAENQSTVGSSESVPPERTELPS